MLLNPDREALGALVEADQQSGRPPPPGMPIGAGAGGAGMGGAGMGGGAVGESCWFCETLGDPGG